ncbi:MAG TPA: BrxA/BrxB family bacilliredoxin [Terriglobia bacterium]|nr:BrxA/BrxB family bacilliredoxin [Terriglobia bacterium]
MYPEEMVEPMREELTRIGFREMKTAEEVDLALGNAKGTTLVFVNSVCGCAAGKARPGVTMALNHSARPDHLTTVFAGQDQDATARARAYFEDYEPSSPSIGLLQGGKAVFMLERRQIEGRMAEEIAADLTAAFDRFCVKAQSAN